MNDILRKLVVKLPLVIIPTKHGILVTPPISPKAQMLGTYESSALRIIQSALRPSDTFVDVGAHAGYYTLMCARLAKKVIAFEPNPSSYKFLRFNIFLNRLKNVIAVRAAVSDFIDQARLYIPKQGGRSLTDQATLVHEGKGSVDVPVVTLDTFLGDTNQPSIIKIDVEGAELNVIKGALRTLAKGVKLMIVELHSPDVKNTIIGLLQGFSYTMSEKSKFLFFIDTYL